MGAGSAMMGAATARRDQVPSFLFVCIWVHPFSSYGIEGAGGLAYFVGSLYVIGEGNQKLLVFCVIHYLIGCLFNST